MLASRTPILLHTRCEVVRTDSTSDKQNLRVCTPWAPHRRVRNCSAPWLNAGKNPLIARRSSSASCRDSWNHRARNSLTPESSANLPYAPERPTTGKVRVARNPPRTKKSGRLVSTLFGECLGDNALFETLRNRGTEARYRNRSDFTLLHIDVGGITVPQVRGPEGTQIMCLNLPRRDRVDVRPMQPVIMAVCFA
jgi:hypothetical protein